MTSNNLDHVITSVARQLTDADPPADLHGRVLAQLGERTSPRWIWRMLAVAAALAVVVITVAIVRRSPAPVTSEPVERSAAVTPAPSSPLAESRPTPTVTRIADRATVATSHVSDVEAAWQTRALPALSQLEALTMEHIQPEVLAIRPLETRPLVIAPIGVGEDRN